MPELQFVCFEVLQSRPIHKVYESKNNNEKNVTYSALRFCFHSWYKRGSNRAFIIGSQYLPFKNYGVKKNPINTLPNFLSCWGDQDLDEDSVFALTFTEIRGASIGVNALIEYDTESGITIIKTISPVTGDQLITINPKIRVPVYLTPNYKSSNHRLNLKKVDVKPDDIIRVKDY